MGTLRRCVAFSPDGRWLVSSGFDRQVLVWDVAGGRLRWAFPSHDSVTITIAFHPSGELLATGDSFANRGVDVNFERSKATF